MIWGSGGILGCTRDSSIENGGSTTRGGLRATAALSACGWDIGGVWSRGLLRPWEWVWAGEVALGAGVMVTRDVSVETSGSTSPTTQRSCAETSLEPVGSGLFQIKNRGCSEAPGGASTTWYSHSRALFASTHLVHGRLASHFWEVGAPSKPIWRYLCLLMGNKHSPFSSLFTIG